jgi:pimeloyl-ACP methyl ester carboxylesterase
MAPRPVLLIAGGDIEDESQADRYIQEGSGDTVELWVAPDAGHTAALDKHPEDWARRVTSFLAAALDLV